MKGWLWKDFQNSRLDGVVAPIWLCPRCALLSPNSKESRKDEVRGLTAQKTAVRELDENPRLFDLMGLILELAVKEVEATGSQVHFAILDMASGQMVQGFKTDRLELGYEEVRRAILGVPREAERYALAWPGCLTREGVRYETILEVGERSEVRAPVIGQRCKQQLPDVKYQPIGDPAILAPQQNLLTLSSDPDAVSKLRPVYTRITADRAHNHGPGHDEALTYEIKKCQELFLDFGDLDRPFLKELQKRPDTVHVVMGRRSWVTSFRPEDKEVILAMDTLVPITGGQPFPGFNEDGMIAIGYSLDSADRRKSLRDCEIARVNPSKLCLV